MSVWLAIASFGVAALLTRQLHSSDSTLLTLDKPNERSLHREPVPSGGGIAIAIAILAAGTVAAVTYSQLRYPAWIALAAAPVAIVSFLDDRSPLSPGFRIGTHLLAAFVLVLGGFVPVGLALPGITLHWPSAVGVTLTVFYVGWMINLYNFMDGMDGFAAGMAVSGFGACALLGSQSEATAFAAISLAIASACAGFLLFNFPPARIFMGDVGSSLLGLLAAALVLWADREDIFPIWAGVLIFSPFIVDATVTLLRRALSGEKIWRAHKTHFYQRLVQLGWGHRRTVLWEYVIMIGAGASAVIALRLGAAAQWAILSGWAIAYAILIWTVYRLEADRGMGV